MLVNYKTYSCEPSCDLSLLSPVWEESASHPSPPPRRSAPSILSPHKARAQTNWSIQRYQRKTMTFLYIVSWVWACNLHCLSNTFSCLYNIPRWSKFFEPCLISTLCASTAKILLKRQFGVSWRPLIMKFFIIACTRGTLILFNLSDMDFPGGPVAIHWSTITYSKPIKNESPNELINPEKS